MLRGIRKIQCSRAFEVVHRHTKLLSRCISTADPLDRPTYNGDSWRYSGDRRNVINERRSVVAPRLEEVFNFSDIKFGETFEASRVRNIHDVKEGGYVEISQKDMDMYLPEGLAGEMDDEFEFSERNAWMIRDSTKLLCRIIEEFENAGKRSRGDTDFTPQRRGLSTPIVLAGLTDRNEWPEATLKAFYYGAELNKGFKRQDFIDEAGSGEKGEEKSVMVTISGEGSPVEEFIKSLQSEGRSLPNRIMLTGPRGVGKSASLSQMVMHARRRGWICLFVPEGWEQVWGGGYIQPITINDTVVALSEDERNNAEDAAKEALLAAEDSDDEDGLQGDEDVDIPAPEGTIYDNVEQTVTVLRGFWLAHSEQLKNIPIQYIDVIEKYDPTLKKFAEAHVRVTSMAGRENMDFLDVRAVVEDDDHDDELDELDECVLDSFNYTTSFRPSNLEELVKLGVAFRDLAGPVFMDLVQELRNLDLPNSPVLFAVDEYNTWEAPSAFHYKMRAVGGKEICVPHSLNFLGIKKAESEAYTMKNGICIGAASSRYPNGLKIQYEDTKSSIPLTIRVPVYSQVEIASCVSYYQQQNVIDGGMNTLDVITYRMQSGSNPRVARKEAVSFFFPLSVSKFSGSQEDMLFGGDGDDGDFGRRGGFQGGSKDDDSDDDDSAAYDSMQDGKKKKNQDDDDN